MAFDKSSGRLPKYGPAHRAARAAALAQLSLAGKGICCRCDQPIYPHDDLHLDHHDDGVTYRGLAHRACNLRAAARLGAQRKNALYPPRWRRHGMGAAHGQVHTSRDW